MGLSTKEIKDIVRQGIENLQAQVVKTTPEIRFFQSNSLNSIMSEFVLLTKIKEEFFGMSDMKKHQLFSDMVGNAVETMLSEDPEYCHRDDIVEMGIYDDYCEDADDEISYQNYAEVSDFLNECIEGEWKKISEFKDFGLTK